MNTKRQESNKSQEKVETRKSKGKSRSSLSTNKKQQQQQQSLESQHDYYNLDLELTPPLQSVDNPLPPLKASYTSLKLILPFWLPAAVNGHGVYFAIDSGIIHNIMDEKTANRIGLTHICPVESISLYDWRKCHATEYSVYTNVRILLERNLTFMTDIWVPLQSTDQVTACRLGIGTLTRLKIIHHFDP
ncbi:hypothetical protein Pmani_016868 [Petrolisthes manimaculis]|uniref:Uncharacterized protein n=1 Tax=Petrolisthes manimaculis TaxID=1843537 RepID=A0AAE1U6B6_9EUCA|nr:hypothetical protein Pmani_016868 [Petrolisthes manimaculis]